MRFVKIFVLLFVLFALPSIDADAQSVKVRISDKRVYVENREFIVHKVRRKETLFSIAKAYSVHRDSIIADNPAAANGIRTGDELLIRTGNRTSIQPTHNQESQNNQNYREHIVQWYEDLSSIARAYSVTEEDIIAANKLEGRKLETRQKILIPQKEKIQKSASELFSDSFDGKLRAVALLPIDSKAEVQPEYNNFIDYYQGMLIALDDLKRERALDLDLKIIDTKEYSNLNQLALSGELSGADIIFGPIFAGSVEEILPYTSQRGIPVVSPMDPAAEKFVPLYNNLFQLTTPIFAQQENLLKDVRMGDHVVFLSEESAIDHELVSVSESILASKGISPGKFSYYVTKDKSAYNDIMKLLDSSRVNKVVIPSNSEAFVYDVLRNLNLLINKDGYSVEIYGTPRWRNFESIEVGYFHSMRLKLSLPYYINYQSPEVSKFLASYRAYFNSEPNAYAFQGYDVTRYFLSIMMRYGKRFPKYTDIRPERMLQSDYLFYKTSDEGGYINQSTRVVRYNPDLTISTVDFAF